MAEELITRPAGADITAILFDLDGTLVDSAFDLMEALNAILRREGLRDVDLQETRAMIGDGVLKLVERALGRTGGNPNHASSLHSDFLAIYEPRAAANTLLYPEVMETLAELRGRYRIGLVTNKPEKATRAILKNLNIASFFEVIIGGDTLPFRKPRPEPLLVAIERLDTEPQCAVMIGDNYHDVQAARAAGLRSIVVTYGYAHGPASEMGADCIIAHMSDLPAALAAMGLTEVG